MNKNKMNVIYNFRIDTRIDDLDEVGKEIEALKFAFGLFFRMMPEPYQRSHIAVLKSMRPHGEHFERLVDFLSQFLDEKPLSEHPFNSETLN
ncbi:hypothetical protein C1Y41_04710 [Pantoea sp. ICBG 1758]|uniref:hypothetical protein n=1 Tax=Pantoea sp. ICBG 1758 TaxID=2071682 RepID=UPI000CE4A76B|nr:hypothetical protein [Pantoea sp. ICBG 1758]PPC63948.1 hypothetical protein C1Y41_04710 [Pantoea sp. ICBG 1758]